MSTSSNLRPPKRSSTNTRSKKGDWSVYEREFLELMDKRQVQHSIAKKLIAGGCRLCSEHLSKHCHRQLVVEYLARHKGNIKATHITEPKQHITEPKQHNTESKQHIT